MIRTMSRRLLQCAFAAAAALMLAPSVPAAAQDLRQNAPGKFDFYVLSLSWSPSFCEAQGERAPRMQCGERPYAFVVHGLWPQYVQGWPEYCQVPAPRLNRNIVSSMLDIMPAPQLVFHQWDKHGTCSGLSPRAYFETVRRARAVVKIPEKFIGLPAPLTVSPAEVEDAFVAANPGLPREAIAVSCDSRRLREVRICMTPAFGFHDCGEVSRRACRRERLVMPPVRGGRGAEADISVPSPEAAEVAPAAERAAAMPAGEPVAAQRTP